MPADSTTETRIFSAPYRDRPIGQRREGTPFVKFGQSRAGRPPEPDKHLKTEDEIDGLLGDAMGRCETASEGFY